MKFDVRIAALSAALALAPFAASAGDLKDMGKKDAKAPLAQGDLEILAKLHESNLMEVAMGKMATEQGKHKDVKGFGKDLVKDHEKADEKGLKVAKKNSATIPDARPADEAEKAKKEEHAQMMTTLRGLSGAAFDKQFAADMVKGHQDTLTMIDQSLTKAESKDVKDLLNDVRPVIQRHLERSQKLVEKLAAEPQT